MTSLSRATGRESIAMLPRMFRFDTPTARLRVVAFLEGLSFITLLFIAMPLKYLGDMPLPVRVVGTLHGGLFTGLAWLVLANLGSGGRGFAWAARIGLASLVPFGTFFLDRDLREADAAYRRGVAAD